MKKALFYIFSFASIVVIFWCSFFVAYGDFKELKYPDNFSFIEVPDPLSGGNPVYSLVERKLPAVGESFFDSSFGTILTRVTEKDGIKGRHEYSRFDPFNVNQSMIILLNPDGLWDVYRTKSYPYNKPANLVVHGSIAEPRWDRKDLNLIWGEENFSIKTLNVKTGKRTLIKDFSKDPVMGPIIKKEKVYRITMMDEGEASMDNRFWAFFLQGDASTDYKQHYIFTWDREKNTVLGVYKIAPNETELDWIGMSPLGTWVLIGGLDNNGGNLAGLTMANKELTQFHRLDYTTAHSDVGLDIYGNEVIVMQNTRTDYIDMIPISFDTEPILENGGSYENTNRIPLVRLFVSSESPLSLQSGVHISANFPGYCVVSTSIEQGLKEQNWLDRTITLVKLDPQKPRVFYLAKVYNTTKEYWEETHASVTNDGKKVVWASNWGQRIGGDQMLLMQLTMPPNWTKLLEK
ncbi:MAG: hypothetical protein M1536_03045 [Firmicutes bacterium]|nr:hypothetical protein [Bacillota bacterium]